MYFILRPYFVQNKCVSYKQRARPLKGGAPHGLVTSGICSRYQYEYECDSAQGDPCTVTIFWSVVRIRLLFRQ
jgi:hypothetical protein